MATYSSLVIVILVVSAAQAHHHSSHNNLPLRVKYKDFNIIEELNSKFEDIEYMIPMFKSLYKSEFAYGYKVLRSLGYNIVNLNNRLKYYKILVLIFEEEYSLDTYKTIELIKDIKVILSDVNVAESTKVSAAILLSDLTDKLEDIGVLHLVRSFVYYKRGHDVPCNNSEILDGIYEFDRELSRYIYHKFVNASYKEEENEQKQLLSFIKRNCNLDLQVVGLLKLAQCLDRESKVKVHQGMLHDIFEILGSVSYSDMYKDSSFPSKYDLQQAILRIAPSCLRALFATTAIRIRNVRTQRYLSIDVVNGQEILASTEDKGKASRWEWIKDLRNKKSAYGYLCKWTLDKCLRSISDQPDEKIDQPGQLVLVKGSVSEGFSLESDGDYCVIQVKRGDASFELAALEGTDNPKVALIDKNSIEYATKYSSWEILPGY